MKGLLLRHDGLFIMNGEVINTESREDGGYEITIRYYETDRLAKNKLVQEKTRIIFQNQTARNDGKPLVPYADIARGMNLQYGNKIFAVVTFPGNDNSVAVGYRIKKSGIMSFRDENGDIEASVISGFITGYKIDRKINAVIFRVTCEPRKNGMPDKYEVLVTNNALARKILDHAIPKDGVYARVAFRVGKKINRNTENITTHELYPCGMCDVMEYVKKGE